MRNSYDDQVCGRSTLWIKGKKAKPFKTLLEKITSEVGGYKEARKYIPISGESYDLVINLEVSAGTGRKIFDAYNRLFKTNQI